MIFRAFRPPESKNASRGQETGVLPEVENSLIPPQLTGQFYWPFFDDIGGGTRVSLRSIGTFGSKVRLIFALYPRSIVP